MNMIVRLLAVLMIALTFAGCIGYVSPYEESYYDYNYPSGYYYGYPSGSYSYGDRSRHYKGGQGRHHDRDDRHHDDD